MEEEGTNTCGRVKVAASSCPASRDSPALSRQVFSPVNNNWPRELGIGPLQAGVRGVERFPSDYMLRNASRRLSGAATLSADRKNMLLRWLEG